MKKLIIFVVAVMLACSTLVYAAPGPYGSSGSGTNCPGPAPGSGDGIPDGPEWDD